MKKTTKKSTSSKTGYMSAPKSLRKKTEDKKTADKKAAAMKAAAKKAALVKAKKESDARLKEVMDQKQIQDDWVFPKKTLSPLEKARKASREKTDKRGKTTKRG